MNEQSHYYIDVTGNFRQNVVAGNYIENISVMSPEMRADIAELRAVSIDASHVNPSIFTYISECRLQKPS
jgi:hypothetical protein